MNIRYPIYEGVYRILTEVPGKKGFSFHKTLFPDHFRLPGETTRFGYMR